MPPFTPDLTPRSTEAETTVLGALLLDPDRIIDVAPVLSPDDFYDPVHASIYEAIERLYDERTPIDFVTVADALKDNEKLQQMGGSAFLADMSVAVPTAAHATKYAEIVREKSLRRKLMKVATSISNLASGEQKNSSELLEFAESQVLGLSRQTLQTKPRALSDLAQQRYDHYTSLHECEDPGAHFGIATGFPALDNLLTGLQPGHLMILAGRPSIGKTAFALNIASNVAAEKAKSVAVFSLEMTTAEVADRLFAGVLGVDAWRLRRDDLSDINTALWASSLMSLPIFAFSSTTIPIRPLRISAAKHAASKSSRGLIC